MHHVNLSIWVGKVVTRICLSLFKRDKLLRLIRQKNIYVWRSFLCGKGRLLLNNIFWFRFFGFRHCNKSFFNHLTYWPCTTKLKCLSQRSFGFETQAAVNLLVRSESKHTELVSLILITFVCYNFCLIIRVIKNSTLNPKSSSWVDSSRFQKIKL